MQKESIFRRLALAVVGLPLLGAAVGLAQLTTGTISGTVTDASGAAVPGATVAIQNTETGITRNTTTGPTGRYEAPNLPVGQYEVRASSTGFQTSVRAGIELTVGRNAVVDHQLQVGEVTQQVTVTGEAPLIETTTATVANLVTEQQVLAVPLNNRDLTQLAYLTPGVIKIPRSNEQTVFGGMGDTLSVAGARGSQNVYLLDGVTNSDLSSNAQGATGSYSGAETVKEFQIITNNYSAEYRSQAGAIVSAVTKSGTNAIHGTVFEFLRNDNLDAANYFDNAVPGRVKPEFKRNQFGGSLGGPIFRDRTFFFGSYEGTRERLSTTDIARVPSINARNGILPVRDSAGNITGTRTVTVSNAIRPYLDLWPTPGQGNAVVEDLGETVRIAGTQSTPSNVDYVAGRFDHQFSGEKAGFLSGTYNFDDSDRNPQGIFAEVTNDGNNHGGLTNLSKKHVASIRHTSVFSATTLNEFNFGFSHTENGGEIPTSDRDFGSLVFHPQRRLVGQINVPGTLDGNSPGFRVGGSLYKQRSYLAKEGLSMTRGNHSFRMGGEINWFRYLQDSCSRGCNGIYEFRSMQDLLTATPRRFEVMLPGGESPVRHLRQLFFGSYFQDNWQVRPSFTLNLGLRYEFATVISDDDGFVSNLRNFFDPNVSVSPTTAAAYPGQTFAGTIDQFYTNPTLKSFSPRFGFAWAPGSRKTSLRGGFGIFYEHPMLFQLRTALQELPPFTVVGRADTSAATPLRFPDAFTTQQSLLRGRPNIRTLEYDMKTTYIYRWSLTLQREFLNEWMVSAGYTGSRALHLVQQGLGNARRWEGWPNNPTGPKFFPANQPLLNPAWGEMRMQAPNGNSYYHGLQVGATKRLSRGVQMQLAYNYSHAIDQGSGVTSTGEALPEGQRGIYYWDTYMKRGPAAFDIRHNFSTTVSYEPTFGQNLTGLAGVLGKGWQFHGVLTLIGGSPLSVLDDESEEQIARIGDAENVRANLVPNGNNNPVLGGPDQYYDASQFLPSVCRGSVLCYARNARGELLRDAQGRLIGDPNLGYAPGFFGNTGKGTLRAPGLATVDFSILKNFSVSETNQVQFRAEFFNFFNRVNFHTPDTSPFTAIGEPDPNAGEIELTRTPARQIQFALKYIF